MTAPDSDPSSSPATKRMRWERISESEARGAAGNDAIEEALAEVSAKSRASADRYQAASHSVADQG